MLRARRGDTVKVHYTGRLADGTIFDASPPDRPLLFILGHREVIDGFDEAVTGMHQGERRTVAVPPEKGYGPRQPELVEEVDRNLLPPGLLPVVGRQLEVTTREGGRRLLMVEALGADSVTLDANHPLAGRELTFEIHLLEVRKPSPGSRPNIFPKGDKVG